MPNRAPDISDERRRVHKLVGQSMRRGSEFHAAVVLLTLLTTAERKRIVEMLSNPHFGDPGHARRAEDVDEDIKELKRYRDGGGEFH